jgi:Domain of unknown function (DUF4340)
MKLKRSTQILFALALVMAAGVAVYEGTLVPERQIQEFKQKKVFGFTEDQVKSLVLTTPDRTIQFDRLPPAVNSSTSTWQLTLLNSTQKLELKETQPQPANEAYVSFLLGLLVNAQSDREIPISVDKKSEYGLSQPQATIEVKLDSDRLHTLVLGGRDFSDTFLYAIANPTTDTTKTLSVLLVSSNFENGVKRSLADWKLQPEKPKLEKPKPTQPKTQPKTGGS